MKMKGRIVYGLIFGLVTGLLGLWGFRIQTLPGAIAVIATFAVTFAIIFAVVSEKAITRIEAFFTHFWP